MARGARRRPVREPYKKVLIVCEGKKTEPNYFKGLKDSLRLNSANVAIVGHGATPSKIVERARQLYQNEKEDGDPYDKVYCVFDRDEHPDYQQSLRMVKREGRFEAIISVPCFEYWLLLHFEYTTRPYGRQSAAHAVVADLKRHLPNYSKNDERIFEKLRDKVETAKKNAAKSLRLGRDNPSTNVHKLVKYLQNIKKR